MRTNKKLFLTIAGLACCAVLVWFSTSTQGREITYRIYPQIAMPEYRTEADRAIPTYERLMERAMDLTESNLTRISTDIQGVVEKVGSIDGKVTQLSATITRIEKILDIKPLPENNTHKQTPNKSLPPITH